MMSKKIVMIGLVAGMSFGVVACKSEVDNKPAAQVEEPKAVDNALEQPATTQPGAAVAAQPATFSLNSENTKIEWVGAKTTGDHKGGFKTITGEAKVGAEDTLTALSFEVDTKSVYSDDDKLTGHLMSADFFDVETHAKATFVMTSIKPGGVDDATHTITGNLNLRGVEKSISFPATIKADAEKLSAKTEFTLKRFDFNIKYEGKADDLIKEDVLMKINIDASKD